MQHSIMANFSVIPILLTRYDELHNLVDASEIWFNGAAWKEIKKTIMLNHIDTSGPLALTRLQRFSKHPVRPLGRTANLGQLHPYRLKQPFHP